MSQAAVHHPSSYGYSGQVGLPATITAAASATFSWQQLDPSTGYTVAWGDGTGNSTFTSSATGTGSAAHTYATNGTYTQTVTNTATGQVVAKRTFTVPYAGGAGFAPRMLQAPPDGGDSGGDSSDGGGDAPEIDAGFDPAAHTIAEVENYVGEHPDQASAVLALEEAGKDRVTLVNWLEQQVPFDPGVYTVGDVEDYVSANPDERDDVLAAEREGRNRSTLVSWLENFTTGE